MIQMIKTTLKAFIPQSVLDKLARSRHQRNLEIWRKKGCPTPPPHIVKQNAIAGYQQKYGHTVLIETGTFRGDMIEAQKKRFKQIISIELANHLFLKAQKRFHKDNNVKLVLGDSGKVLVEVLKDLQEPAIFWLDGHYSAGVTAKGEKDCPIFEEIDAIFNNNNFNHILLIDDARLFNGTGDYPTIENLTAYVKGKNEKYQVQVDHDIIRYVI